MDEENNTVISSYIKRDGTGLFDGYPELARDAMSQFPISGEIFPANLPRDENILLKFTDGNLIVNDAPEVAESCYTVEEISKQRFYIFDGNGRSGKKNVGGVHAKSSAEDIVKYDVCCCTFTIYTDCSDVFSDGTLHFMEGILDDMGHSFWKIDVDANHVQLVPKHLREYIGKPYGFYPRGDIHDGKGNDFYDVNGALIEEESHYNNLLAKKTGTALHVWHISFDGCLSGLESTHLIQNNKPKYDLACFNCTDAAVSVGRACGAPVPDAGIPDLSILETIRGWDKSFGLSRTDGTYSSPLGLLVNLYSINKMYGENE